MHALLLRCVAGGAGGMLGLAAGPGAVPVADEPLRGLGQDDFEVGMIIIDDEDDNDEDQVTEAEEPSSRAGQEPAQARVHDGAYASCCCSPELETLCARICCCDTRNGLLICWQQDEAGPSFFTNIIIPGKVEIQTADHVSRSSDRCRPSPCFLPTPAPVLASASCHTRVVPSGSARFLAKMSASRVQSSGHAISFTSW